MDQALTLREMVKKKAKLPTTTQRIGTNSFTRVLAVTSGKGGVGKTNVVANLAFAFTKLAKKVLILDADLGLANIDVMLGLTPKFNFSHILRGEKTISDIIIEGPWGIKILPASSGIQELTALTEEQKMQLINELDGLDGFIDILLIDTAAGISSNVIYFNLAAQEIVVVVSPEPPSITDAYALMKILSTRYSEKHFKLIINSVDSSKEAEDVFRNLHMTAERFLNISIDYLGYILRDENVVKAVRKQKLVAEIYPESKASQCFFRIANKIASVPPLYFPTGNIQFFWKQLLQRDEVKAQDDRDL